MKKLIAILMVTTFAAATLPASAQMTPAPAATSATPAKPAKSEHKSHAKKHKKEKSKTEPKS